MRRSLRAAACAAGLAAVLPAPGSELACGDHAPLSLPLRMDYAVTASRSVLALSGDGTVVYRPSGDDYAMESSLRALGVFEAQQTSAGAIRPAGLVPRAYTEGNSRRPTRSVEFDWKAQRVTFSQTGESQPTQPQMQDRLSLLMHLAWRQRREPQAAVIKLPVAGLRHTSIYVFNAQGAEVVNVPAGRFDTVKFERHKDDGDDAFEVWLAPGLCSLPVRLRFTNDRGLVIEQQLRALQMPAPKP
jgi:hypothetical protein